MRRVLDLASSITSAMAVVSLGLGLILANGEAVADESVSGFGCSSSCLCPTGCTKTCTGNVCQCNPNCSY